jgi:outer membrane protein assembly factor BamC
MCIERAGSQRWLVVQQAYSITYSDVRDFILAVGLALESEDKDTGLLETTWADNWANNVLTGMQKWLQKGLGSIYTSATRDKYRFRVEPGRVEGTSEVYVTHKGMIQKAIIDNSYDPQRTIWEPIPPDPEIEAEMLARLMVDLGASEVKASENLAAAEKAPDRASIVQSANGQPELIVNDGVDIAWRRVGQTLDRVGFSLEDRDEVKRVYVVRYADPDFSNKKPGFFSKMFKKDKAVDEGIYQILLTGQGDKTTVNVTAKDGTPAPKKVTTQIINLLYEQLR